MRKGQVMSKVKAKFRARTESGARDESGAVLILAMVYLISVIVVVTSLAGWVTNDLNNTANFSEASSSHLAISGTMNVAVAAIRNAPLLSNSQAQGVASALSYCWTPASGLVSEEFLDNTTVAVWCSTVENLDQSNTRVVSLYACPTTLTAASLSAAVSLAASNCQDHPTLASVVTFNDYPPGGSAPLTKQCTLWCGQGMFMESWVWN
jgi:hypothetical protein